MRHKVLLAGSLHVEWIGIRATLSMQHDFYVIEESNMEDIIAAVQIHTPDLILLATEHSDSTTEKIAVWLRCNCPEIKLILIGDLLPVREHAASQSGVSLATCSGATCVEGLSCVC